MPDGRYLVLMCLFYALTVAIEMPILIVALSRRHPMRHRIFAGLWLTACTYPFVWLIFPNLIDRRERPDLYLAVAETFAPAAECLLFYLAFGKAEPRTRVNLMRDMIAIVVANLASFLIGVLLMKWSAWMRFVNSVAGVESGSF